MKRRKKNKSHTDKYTSYLVATLSS